MNLCGTCRGFAFTWANISIGFQTDDGLTKMSWTFFSDLRPVNGRVNWVLVPWGRPIAPHGPAHSLGTFLSVKTIQVEISNEGFVCIDRHQVPSVPCRLLLCWSYLGLLELGKSQQTFPGYFCLHWTEAKPGCGFRDYSFKTIEFSITMRIVSGKNRQLLGYIFNSWKIFRFTYEYFTGMNDWCLALRW